MVVEIESDVLVIGTGGAGLRAAIEADERGASVVVVSKAPAGMNNATMVAAGGFRAAIEGFTPEEHIEDTLRVGNYLNDRSLVEAFAREGGMRVLELERFGVEMRVRRGGISVGDTPGVMGMGMTKPMVEYLRARAPPGPQIEGAPLHCHHEGDPGGQRVRRGRAARRQGDRQAIR
jgi:succinate dehydrogenase/fumarate reductase flavoprotein subunit